VTLRHPKLIWKLLAINCLALSMVLAAVWLSVHLLAANYFMTLVEEYDIAPSAAHAMFVQAVDRYLLLASVIGFFAAALLSLWLSFRQTRPISQITISARLIAAGNYDQRVTARGCGEVDLLGEAFNEMASSLQQGERLRKDFIVDVSHELRTPMTNILGYMEGLKDDVIAPDKVVFSSIHEEAQTPYRFFARDAEVGLRPMARAEERIPPSEVCRTSPLLRRTIRRDGPLIQR
jgi:signal transduction histidine kinase